MLHLSKIINPFIIYFIIASAFEDISPYDMTSDHPVMRTVINKYAEEQVESETMDNKGNSFFLFFFL